ACARPGRDVVGPRARAPLGRPGRVAAPEPCRRRLVLAGRAGPGGRMEPATGAVATIPGQGTAESDWQQCSWLWPQPPPPAQKLFGSARRLVVVAPHPDDEVLGCGGLMRLAVEAG